METEGELNTKNRPSPALYADQPPTEGQVVTVYAKKATMPVGSWNEVPESKRQSDNVIYGIGIAGDIVMAGEVGPEVTWYVPGLMPVLLPAPLQNA